MHVFSKKETTDFSWVLDYTLKKGKKFQLNVHLLMTGIRDCCETSFMKTFSCRLNGSWKKGGRNYKPNYKKYCNLFQSPSNLFIHAFFCIFCAIYTFFQCFECLVFFHSNWCQFPFFEFWQPFCVFFLLWFKN